VCAASTNIGQFKALTLAKEPRIQDFKASQEWPERIFARNTLCIKTKNKAPTPVAGCKILERKVMIKNKLRTTHFKAFEHYAHLY
jgi:hypothetical protein